MSVLALPYGLRFREDGRLETFPIAEIILIGRNKQEVGGVFLLDSGATTSVAPAHDAELLGIPLPSGRRTIIRGLGNIEFSGYQHTVRCSMKTAVFSIPIIFIQDPAAPRILGREGFFGNFGVLFDEAKHRTALLETRTERRRIDALFNKA